MSKKPEFDHLLINRRQNIYVVLEDMNFFWSVDELEKVINFWNQGFSIWKIGKVLNRDIDEIALLLIELAERYKNLICERSKGLFASLYVDHPHYYQNRIKRLLKHYFQGYEVFREFDIDFFWDEYEVIKFEEMWNKGLSLEDISRNLNRVPIDCFLLLLDRLRKETILGREGLLNGFWKKTA